VKAGKNLNLGLIFIPFEGEQKPNSARLQDRFPKPVRRFGSYEKRLQPGPASFAGRTNPAEQDHRIDPVNEFPVAFRETIRESAIGPEAKRPETIGNAEPKGPATLPSRRSVIWGLAIL
jgi:hypothetical protein